MSAAIAAGIAAPIIGGIIGDQASQGDSDRQRADIDAAIAEIRKIMPPDPDDQKVFLDNLKVQGILTPEMEETIKLGPTAFEGINTDPALRQAQLDSLSKLAEVGENGYTLQEDAQLNKLRNQQAAMERGSREAILSNQRQRGMGGSGMELAAQLSNQQSSAQMGRQDALDVAAQGQRRALEAMMQRGQLAGDVRGQDFGQAARIAEAKDRIAEFNARNTQGVAGRNVDRSNHGQEYNLNNAQRVADANVGISNEQKYQHVDARQQGYDNEMDKARGVSGGLRDRSDYHGGQANATRARWAGVGSAVGQGAGAYGQYQQDQEYLDYLKSKDRTT